MRVLDRMRLYARHEFLSSLAGPYTLGRMRDRNSTVFGVSADYREGQSVFSEYRVGNGISGRGAHAAIGLRNQWEIDEGVRLHSSFERVSPMDTLGGGNALAVTGGMEITSSPFWKATARVEYRASERQDHVLGYGGLRQADQRPGSPSSPRASGARFWMAALYTSGPGWGWPIGARHGTACTPWHGMNTEPMMILWRRRGPGTTRPTSSRPM